MDITSEHMRNFSTNGAVLLKGAFSEFVEDAQNAIEENIENPSWRERTYKPDDGGQAFFQDYVVWNKFDGYRNLVKNSKMASMAAKLMNSNTARIFHDHILVKEPGNSVVTPWHQDQPYYLCEGEQTISFWVPLDYIPRERTIEYIAGSHAWGKNFKPQRFDGTDLFQGDKSEVVPDVANMRDQFDILGWEMNPGDAVAFHFRTLHGAPANTSKIRRRVISIRWVGDDARYAKRLGPTSPAFPDLIYKDGDPFDGDEFPILFPKTEKT